MFNNLSVKEAVLGAIKGLPDNCTIEDIIGEIQTLSSLLDSFKDIDRGQYLTPEQLIDRVDKGQ